VWTVYSVNQKILPGYPLKFLNLIFQRLTILKPYFTLIFGVQTYVVKFYSIILEFDVVMPYYACSPRDFFIFTIMFDKKMFKVHKFLGYYSYKNSQAYSIKCFFWKIHSWCFTTGQSTCIQTVSRKSVASRLISAAVHLLAPEWFSALSL